MTLLLVSLAYSVSAHAAGCDFEAVKEVLARTPHGYTAAWTTSEAPELDDLSPPDGRTDAYAAWVREHTRFNARENLANHIAVGEKIARQLSPGDPFVKQVRESNALVRKVIDGQVGRIRRMNCLESIPFREFLKVLDLRGNPKEMLAMVFRKNGRLRLVADLYSDGASGGVQESATLLRERRLLTREGWELLAHLHNHPFDFTNPYGDWGGQAMPSQPDVEAYLSLRPIQSLVTNGIDTIELRASEIPLLQLPR